MKNNVFIQTLVIICIFIVAIVLELTPWPVEWQYYKPSWIILVLMYWILALPNRINVGAAFILGLIWDLSLGSVLGLHALILSIFSYLLASNYLLLRNLSLIQQSLLVIVFVSSIKIAIFLVELFLYRAQFEERQMIGSFASAVIWPWIYLFLRQIRRQFKMS